MITRSQQAMVRRQAADLVRQCGVPVRQSELAAIEVADFGTGFMLPADFFVVTPEMEEYVTRTGKPYALVINVANKDDYRTKVLPVLREKFGV